MLLKFSGKLAEFAGSEVYINASSPSQAVNLIASQIKGMKEFIKKHQFKVRADKTYLNNETVSWETEAEVITIEPALFGAKKGGFWSFIAGIFLVGAAFLTGGVSLFASSWTLATKVAVFGATLALSGLSSMLSPVQDYDSADNEDSSTAQSFIFSQAVNSQAQGSPLPLVYGRFGVGSLVVSTGVSVSSI